MPLAVDEAVGVAPASTLERGVRRVVHSRQDLVGVRAHHSDAQVALQNTLALGHRRGARDLDLASAGALRHPLGKLTDELAMSSTAYGPSSVCVPMAKGLNTKPGGHSAAG